MNRNLGWPVVIVLSLIPLVLWLSAGSFSERFMTGSGKFLSYRHSMQAIGQALGLAGMAMFALNFILGARLRWMESLFGGMNKVYIAHHILGGLAFVLLLFHPLFLVIQYLGSGGAALTQLALLFVYNPACFASFGITNPDCSTLWGVIGLSLMIVFLWITFYARIRYQLWKLAHQFLGLGLFFGALHALFIPSDITTVQVLKYYMFSLIALAFLAILYRTLLGFLLVPRAEFVVDEVRRANENIIEIVLSPKSGKAFTYTPGQFIFIGFPDSPGLSEVHPFSLSSAPGEGRISIGVKALGDYTKSLLETLKPGARALIEGPFGRTSCAYYPRKEQIWIAGGIGITPFLGMARSLKPGDGYKVDLYYSAMSGEDAAFDSELRAIAAANPSFRLIPWYGKEKGFLTADAIVAESAGVLDKEVFLCGPPPMMKSLKEQFVKWKIPASQIHSEEFALS